MKKKTRRANFKKAQEAIFKFQRGLIDKKNLTKTIKNCLKF